MRVLVTGGAGHVGNNVVRALLEDGHEVRCLIRSDDEALEGLNVERVTGDLLNRDSLRASLSGMEAVIHSAAFVGLNQSEAEKMHAINVEGTRTLLEESDAAKVRRFVHFSSVHGLRQGPFDEPLTETNALADSPEDHPYDRTKAQAERLILNHSNDGLKTCVLNPTAILGPHDYKPSRLGKVVRALGNGEMPVLVDSGLTLSMYGMWHKPPLLRCSRSITGSDSSSGDAGQVSRPWHRRRIEPQGRKRPDCFCL